VPVCKETSKSANGGTLKSSAHEMIKSDNYTWWAVWPQATA